MTRTRGITTADTVYMKTTAISEKWVQDTTGKKGIT